MNCKGRVNLKNSVEQITSDTLKLIVAWRSISHSVAHREAMTVSLKTIEKFDRSADSHHVIPTHIPLQYDLTNPRPSLGLGVRLILKVSFQILAKNLSRRVRACASPVFCPIEHAYFCRVGGEVCGSN
jgi:hypothetical protein